jgi:hypothetical protein
MIALFVRSYPGDFEWLSYSVKSMAKNLTGIDEKVLVVPVNTEMPTHISDYFDRVHYVRESHKDGYIAQQLDKVRAHEFTDAEYILFSDSDCIYYEPFDAHKDRFVDNRILLPVTPYTSLSGDVLMWQGITQKVLGSKPTLEYMRCFPIVHHRSVCLSLVPAVFSYARNLTDRSLSEFNCMGLQAELYAPELYYLKLADSSIKTAKQYWSWGGITETVQMELETL